MQRLAAGLICVRHDAGAMWPVRLLLWITQPSGPKSIWLMQHGRCLIRQ
jgi:hypothetical protein